MKIKEGMVVRIWVCLQRRSRQGAPRGEREREREYG